MLALIPYHTGQFVCINKSNDVIAILQNETTGFLLHIGDNLQVKQ